MVYEDSEVGKDRSLSSFEATWAVRGHTNMVVVRLLCRVELVGV